jgi:hypothetical protein
MEQLKKYLLTKSENLMKNWHTYLFDIFFIIGSLTFIPLVGLVLRFLNERFFTDLDSFTRLLNDFCSLVVLFFLIICRIFSLYLKQFSIQNRKLESSLGTQLFKWNIFAIFLSYLLVLLMIIRILISNRNENWELLQAIIKLIAAFVGTVLVFAVPFEISLFSNLRKNKKTEKKLHKNRWLASPWVEFIANCLLFVYILFFQYLYYQQLQRFIPLEKIKAIYSFNFSFPELFELVIPISSLFILFLIFYVAPRMIYSKSYGDKGTNWSMLGLVFVSTFFGFFLPSYLAWLF